MNSRVATSTFSDCTPDSSNIREEQNSAAPSPKPSPRPSEEHELEPARKLEQFKAILTRFSKTVQDRQLSQKLGVKCKAPEEYTFQDVLSITEKLHQQHKSAADVGNCTGRLRKFFRTAGENRGTLKKILEFVPGDVYGSLICGGFTVILVALGRADTLRKDIYSILAEIPQTLECVEVLTDIHDGTPKLRLSANSVLLAIFDLLALIIDELSKGVKTKALQVILKGESYRSDIQEAVKSLQARTATFKDLSQLCDSARLERVEKSQMKSEKTVEDLHRMVAHLKEWVTRKQEAFDSLATDQNALELDDTPNADTSIGSSSRDHETQKAEIEVGKRLLKACAGDESLDDRNERKPDLLSKSEHRLISPPYRKDTSRKAAAKWLRGLELRFDKIARKDLKATTRSELSIEEQDQAQWILCSDHLLEWLEARSSQILVIEAETPPENVLNALSFSAGFLARCIALSYNDPVLYYSCGLRNEESPDDESSGAIALVNSFNAQLVEHLLKNTSADLLFLGDSKYRDSQKSIRHGFRVFKSLAGSLRQGACVFMIIDSLSRLSGLESDGDAAMKGILRLIHDRNITLKLLVTDPLPTTQLRNKGYLWLFASDEIAGGGHGMNLQFLQDDTRDLLRKSDQKRRGEDSSGDSDSVAMSDSSDDDDWD